MMRIPLRSIHGAIDYQELASLHLSPEEVVDFSVNSNPYGPSPAVYEALRHFPLDRYPDRDCLQLRQAILDYALPDLKRNPSPLTSLVCGNGTSELIWVVPTTFLHPGDSVAIVGPTFGEYSTACRAAGASVTEILATADEQFQPDSHTISLWLQQLQPRLVWLCNPNNPTGSLLEPDELFRIARRCMRIGALLVIDESYHHFVFPSRPTSAVDLFTQLPDLQLVVLRSLTKDFALAGLRLGYAVVSPSLASRLRSRLPSWNVSAPAQVAGCAALQDHPYLLQSLLSLQQERQNFFLALHTLNLTVVPSQTHFCLLHVKNAQEIRSRLLQSKLLVRECSSFSLPDYIRVSTRPSADWVRLIAALREVLA